MPRTFDVSGNLAANAAKGEAEYVRLNAAGVVPWGSTGYWYTERLVVMPWLAAVAVDFADYSLRAYDDDRGPANPAPALPVQAAQAR